MNYSNPIAKRSPKVSISLITYNHAEYIKQAIESILMQVANFDYEVIIGEDDSSDGTREIVLAYQEKYPDKIKVFLNSRKDVIFIDGKPTGRWNLINNLRHCRGEYIALLEGDDYWTDPYKLQKQVEFLDHNPDYSLCFHKVVFKSEDNRIHPLVYEPFKKKESYSLGDLIQKNFIATLSVLYRNSDLYSNLPEWFSLSPVGDYPLHLLTAENGSIGYLDEQMGVRRIHEDGFWSAMSLEKKYHTSLKIQELIYKYFEDGEHSKAAKSSLYYSEYRYDYIRRKRVSSLVNLIKCLCFVPTNISVQDRGLLKSILDIVLPLKMKENIKSFFLNG